MPEQLISPGQELAVARRLGYSGIANSIMRRVGRYRNRFYQSPNSALTRSAAVARQRAARSNVLTMRRRKRQTTGIGVTEQHDSRLIYRKSRMPRRQKRRWKLFRNKVLAVSEKDLGTQQVVFNKTLTNTQNVDGYQTLVSFGLYTLKSNQTHYNDLNHISDYYTNAVTTPATGLTVDPSSKIIFKSGVLDVTIRNSSTYYNGTANVSASEARLEVDVYEMIMRHTAEETGTTYNVIEDIFNQNKTVCSAIGGGATTEIDYGLRGVTPFELSYALSRFGIQILRKTKYQISNNDQVTYQMRDPRRHSTTLKEMRGQDGFNKPGWTRLVYIVGKLAPGLTLGSTLGTYQATLQVGITRKYTMKVENYTEDRTAYDTY